MFLIRSAFWLTVAFVAIHPPGVDLGATASALSGQAVAAGQKLVVEQLIAKDCALTRCAPTTPPRLTASLAIPSAGLPMQDSPALKAAPIPRPRPHWMG